MPVIVNTPVRRMEQVEFGRIAYRVMETVFAVRNEMGRFFLEPLYRDAIAGRLSNVQTEVPIEVRFEGFVKKYYIDLLVGDGAVFELKTVGTFNARHRTQLLNYLLLTELAHGKLINLRSEHVEHEFVNTTLMLADRVRFCVESQDWRETASGSEPLAPWVVRMLRDLGAGLDLQLYQDAVTHFLGGEEKTIGSVPVFDGGRTLGTQRVRLADPSRALKITALDDAECLNFKDGAHRFLQHTPLRGIQWINITRNRVTFTTLEK